MIHSNDLVDKCGPWKTLDEGFHALTKMKALTWKKTYM